ncbi:MAG: alpha/beta fold hydrolase [Planctomycetota bacterium]
MLWHALLIAGTTMLPAQDDVLDLTRGLFRGAARRITAPVPSQPGPPPRRTGWGPQIKDYVVQTADGWKLVLHRYRVPGQNDPSKFPVILCHGFSYNGNFFDLSADVTLARYLANQGFDVWVADLRGSGQSHKWALTIPNPSEAMLGRLADQLEAREIPRQGFVSLDPKFADWDMDDHIEHDVPAILNAVKHYSGMPRVSWLGHSMGGNIMLAYLARHGQDNSVGKLVTVGSQLTMPKQAIVEQVLLEMLESRTRQVSADRPVVNTFAESSRRVFFNEQNVDSTILAGVENFASDMPSIGLVQQYIDLCRVGTLRDASRRRRYVDGLNKIQCPYLIVSGAEDRIAPPSVQQEILDRVSSPQRYLLILGKQNGFRTDYGHSDSLLGRNAREEVYPVLARWLAGERVGRTE